MYRNAANGVARGELGSGYGPYAVSLARSNSAAAALLTVFIPQYELEPGSRRNSALSSYSGFAKRHGTLGSTVNIPKESEERMADHDNI